MNKKTLFLIFCFILTWNAVLLLFNDGVKGEKNFEILAKNVEDSQTSNLPELIAVYNHTGGIVEDVPLEEYIARVLCAEMPISYGLEALKAQAVAARTYTIYCMNNNREKLHSADVCTDYKHCQAYKSAEVMKDELSEFEKSMIYRAVNETEGEILTFENQPINAVYHASSDGFTEDAKQVWGNSVPYLLSVASPDESSMQGFHSEISLSFEGFIKKLNYAGYNCNSPSGSIELLRNSSGRTEYVVVKQCSGDDVLVSGTNIRNIFSLRSCAFDISIQGGNVVFTVRGYGHGVGLSQYGAKVMAEAGKNYRDILTHYYSGCEIVSLCTIENI